MKKTITYFLHSAAIMVVAIFFSSCATIFGGSRYNAHVTVEDHPNATISYNGSVRGKGYATIKVKRKDANKLSFVVKEPGCEPLKVEYLTRSFRTWAFIGTMFGWTGAVNGFPVPFGAAVDLATGAVWKPNVREKGIKKDDYKNFNYQIEYKGCPVKD